VTVERVRTGDALLDRTFVPFLLTLSPAGVLPRISVSGEAGEDVDLVGARVGTGATLSANVVLQPTKHLSLDLRTSWSWLDVPVGASRDRLFTAQIHRAKVVYNFSRRLFLRLIGEYTQERRDPALYPEPVVARSGVFLGSALLAYRLNWQTALFAGYGDDREEVEAGRFRPSSRQFFAKVSYAFQR
jgi:hypothetical protein